MYHSRSSISRSSLSTSVNEPRRVREAVPLRTHWLAFVLRCVVLPEVTILRMIVMALMRDLELVYSLSEVNPRIQHRQVGDIDLTVFMRHISANTLTSILLEQLNSPFQMPIVGPGSAIEQKVTGVLENYRTCFSEPFRLFQPPGPHKTTRTGNLDRTRIFLGSFGRGSSTVSVFVWGKAGSKSRSGRLWRVER
ncbi:hypothetical protein B0H14DRAFT_1684908 [Mycena olivaceomarginata]|nr:hypothetical protein B0H14DRAFT_1684908 [Mycena olivaceomarginata]